MAYTKRSVAIKVAAALTLILSIMVTINFAGCSMISLIPGQANRPQADGSVTTTTTTMPVTEPPVVIPQFFNPLTGLATTEDMVACRPVSVCIGNTSYSLPQYGIGTADILIEVPVEGGITRLMMVTTNYALLEKVGSVRSTRSSLAAVADSFDAIQFYAGTCDEGSSKTLPYDTLDYLMQDLGTIFYRDTARNAPHNLMTSGSLMVSGITELEYRTSLREGFSAPFVFAPYGEKVTYTDGAAKSIRMTYSSVQVAEFSFDDTTRQYTRRQLGETQIDANTSQALSFTNVAILFCDTVTYNTAEGTTLDLSLARGGSGYLCTEGTKCAINWSVGEDGSIDLYNADGTPLVLNRGTSYIGFMKAGNANAIDIR